MHIEGLATIGIKTFMRPKSLQPCLESIRKYYPVINIIVADDSNDVIKELNTHICEDNKVTYLDLPFDTGTGAGRARLTKATETKYYITIDDDMVFTEKTKLEKMINFLERADYDLIGGNVNDGKSSFYMLNYKEGEVNKVPGYKELIKSYNITVLSCDFIRQFFIARKSLLNNFTWDEELKTADHLEFFIRLKYKANAKIAYTGDVSINHIHTRNVYYSKFRYGRKNKYVRLAMQKIRNCIDATQAV